MRLFAPKYYPAFKCIADKCMHSCCVGWEIDIDSVSVSRYKKMKESGCCDIFAAIDFDSGEQPHFRLKSNGSCPHLCDTGLCNVIIKYGEDALCDICREHPRFYNASGDYIEVGIGAVCEEAARLILECDDYKTLIEVGERADFDDVDEENFNTGAVREHIYDILSNESLPYGERILSLWESYECPPSAISDERWRNLLSSLEYLNEDNSRLFQSYSSRVEQRVLFDKVCERFLAYLIYRHLPEVTEPDQLREALGFCFFTERLFASLLNAEKKSDTGGAYLIARIISEEIEYSLDNTSEIMTEFEFI